MTTEDTVEPPDERRGRAVDVLHALLQPVFARETRAPLVRNVGFGPELGSADLLLSFPMGWRIAFQVLETPISPARLTLRTNVYAAVGVDVIWWLSGAADGGDLHAWQCARWGVSYAIDLAGDRPALKSWRQREGTGEHVDVPAASTAREWADEAAILRLWREVALVRYCELWTRVSAGRFQRALRGTDRLRRSFGGMINGLNQQRLVHRVRGRDGLWRPVDLESIYPSIPRWSVEGIAAARERAWNDQRRMGGPGA